jgi:hypothetical protein
VKQTEKAVNLFCEKIMYFAGGMLISTTGVVIIN